MGDRGHAETLKGGEQSRAWMDGMAKPGRQWELPGHGRGRAEQMGEAIWGAEGGMLPRRLKEAPGRETACSEQLEFLYSFCVCVMWFFYYYYF